MQTVKLALNAMATRFELLLHGEHVPSLRAAGEEVFAEVERLENQLSLYRSGSEIAQVNARAAREPVQVSPEVFTLLSHAAKLSLETDGAFDVTIAPLVRCWGFMGDTGKMPSPDDVSAALAKVGMRHVLLDAANRTVRFDCEGVMLDLGAIGKGYAVERAVQILRDAGVTSALLHGGTSTVYAIGRPPEADAWKVSLDQPPSSTKISIPQLSEIALCDEALSVSAIWGRSFRDEEKTFGHIIDPCTGQPVDSALLAVVILPSATETDALSTAMLTAGSAGFKTISSLRPCMRTVLVEASGEVSANL